MDTHPPETDAFRVETADLERNYHNIDEARWCQSVFVMQKEWQFPLFLFDNDGHLL